MKLVTINGSPRKNGCSAKLLNKIAEGTKDAGGKTTDFHINTMKVVGCQGCLACKKTNPCVINDEMTTIYEAINEADFVAVSVPIYFHEMSSQLKTLVDRMYPYLSMDSNFQFSSSMPKGKKCILVVPYGNYDSTVYNDYVKALEDRFKFFGFEEISAFIASDSMSEHPEYLEDCYNIGKSL